MIEKIVAGGLKYRTRKGNPLTRPELEKLNQLLAGVNFKIPDLWDPAFLESLPKQQDPTPATSNPEPPAPPAADKRRASTLEELRLEFLALHGLEDRQKAGLKLEGLLNRLFALFDLAPEKPFRVTGEQIDGSFILDHEVYLLEAKWTREPIDPKELYAFRVKIEGKSSYTRGLFISMSGFTTPAVEAISQGKAPNFVMVDGAHLYRVLQGQVDLDVLLPRLVRHLGERGESYLPVQRLGEGD